MTRYIPLVVQGKVEVEVTEMEEVVLVEVVITAIVDNRPSWRHGKKKAMVVGAVSLVAFLIGILFTTQGGSELLDLVDTFAGQLLWGERKSQKSSRDLR